MPPGEDKSAYDDLFGSISSYNHPPSATKFSWAKPLNGRIPCISETPAPTILHAIPFKKGRLSFEAQQGHNSQSWGCEIAPASSRHPAASGSNPQAP